MGQKRLRTTAVMRYRKNLSFSINIYYMKSTARNLCNQKISEPTRISHFILKSASDLRMHHITVPIKPWVYKIMLAHRHTLHAFAYLYHESDCGYNGMPAQCSGCAQLTVTFVLQKDVQDMQFSLLSCSALSTLAQYRKQLQCTNRLKHEVQNLYAGFSLKLAIFQSKHRVRLPDVLERQWLTLNLLQKLVMFMIIEKLLVVLEYVPAFLNGCGIVVVDDPLLFSKVVWKNVLHHYV